MAEESIKDALKEALKEASSEMKSEKTWSAAAKEWVFSQGTSTVLLVSLVLTLIRGGPWLYEQGKSWHDAMEDRRITERKEQNEKNAEERLKTAEWQSKKLDKLILSSEKEVLLLENMTKSIDRVGSEIIKNQKPQ